MSKQAKKGCVPVLRFPEFREAEEWEEKLIEDFFLVGSSKRVLQEDWTSQGVPFFRTRELVSLSKNEPFSSEIFISEELFNELSQKYGLPSEGDFLVSGVGTLGISYQVQKGDKFYFKDGNVLWLKIKNGLVSSYFKYCFQSDGIQNQIIAQTSKSTVGTYTIQNAKKTKFWYPSYIEEQQKIAACLSSLDELITAQAQKLEALKTHKKGLMQQLFPAEGETVPKLRFPEFREAGEWELKELGQLATYTKGFAFKSQDYRSEGVRIIRVSDLGADFIKSDNEKIYIACESVEDYEKYKLNKGEIIITTVGSKPELVDSAVGRGIFVHYSNEGLLNQNLLKLEVFDEVNSKFLFSNINTTEYQEFIASISRGNANQANIAVKELMKFELKVPGPNEQQKIANCLSSIDELITAQAQKIEALKTHKKGLMQQLFPSSDEVAG